MLRQLPLWVWLGLILGVIVLAALATAYRHLRKLQIHWGWLAVTIVIAIAVFVGSLLIFPKEWGGALAIALAVMVLQNTVQTLADLRALITKDPKPDPPAPHTTASGKQIQINQGESERNIQPGRDYVEEQHIHLPPAELPPIPHGFIPPPNVEVYVPRGKIESDVRARLARKNIAAIVGVHAPGGVGKTELAKRAASDLAEEFETTFWIDVGEKTPEQVLADLVKQCNLNLLPALDYHQQAQEFKRFCQGHSLLIVLDDVRPANAGALADFLPPSPPCAALITSRAQQLSAAIPLSATFELDRMTPGQARALLEAALTPAHLETEPEAVETLMQRCQFNPLALSIAARRIQLLSGNNQPVGLFVEKLQKRLSELNVGDDPRLNIFAVFDLSYNSLSADDQQRFRRLAAFAPTGFGLPAAAHVWGGPPDEAGSAVARLLNLSLLKVVPGQTERYRLHDLLDEYAADKLQKAGGDSAVRRAHAEFLLKLFDEHYNVKPEWLLELEPELDNLRQAARWATKAGESNLLALLATKPRNWLYNVFRAWDDWRDWLTAALQMGVKDRGLQANVRKAIGDVQQFRDDRDAALASYEEALRLFRAVGDKLGEANVLQAIGDVQQFRKEMDAALASYEEALRLFRAVGAKLGEANVRKAIGDVQQFRDERDAALESYNEALRLFKAVGDKLGEANVRKAIGDVQQFRDERDAALESYNEALRLFRAVGDKLGEANVLQAIGDVQQFRKETDAALESYNEALRLFKAVGDKLGEANVRKAIGDVQQFRDDRDAALASYEEALRLFRAVGDKLGEANVYLALGGLKRSDKNVAGARADFEGALRSYRAIGDHYSEARALYRLGDCAADEGNWQDALAIYRQAAELWEGIGLSDLVAQILAPKIAVAEKQLKG